MMNVRRIIATVDFAMRKPRRCGRVKVNTFRDYKKGRNGMRASGLVFSKETEMPQSKIDPAATETGEQVPAKPHDSGSAANETDDGLDATTEALRRAAEDTPSGALPDDVEKTPVFDRADLATKI